MAKIVSATCEFYFKMYIRHTREGKYLYPSAIQTNCEGIVAQRLLTDLSHLRLCAGRDSLLQGRHTHEPEGVVSHGGGGIGGRDNP